MTSTISPNAPMKMLVIMPQKMKVTASAAIAGQ